MKTQELYNSYRKCPANSFHRPILYRVTHAPSAAESEDIQPRLFPPQVLETLSIPQLCESIDRHSDLDNRKPTPFISLTSDLIRALHLVFYTYRQSDARILLICAWKLKPGSYIPLNDLRKTCGLPSKNIYNTETLVWGKIPATSIICQWHRVDIVRSGLLGVFPALTNLQPAAKLCDLRHGLFRNIPPFFARNVARALVDLRMEPSRFQIKQVFFVLLSRAAGFPVEQGAA